MDPLVVFVIFGNIKNKCNFSLIKVMSTLNNKTKYFCIKRYNTIIRQCSQHKCISKMKNVTIEQ